MYRKRLPLTQLLALAICGILRFHYGRSWSFILTVFLIIQISALAGAWWNHRLMRQMDANQQ